MNIVKFPSKQVPIKNPFHVKYNDKLPIEGSRRWSYGYVYNQDPYDFRGAVQRSHADRELIDVALVHLSDLAMGIARALDYADDKEAAEELQVILGELVSRRDIYTFGKFIPDHLLGFLFWFDFIPPEPTKSMYNAHFFCFSDKAIMPGRPYQQLFRRIAEQTDAKTVLYYKEVQLAE